MDTTDAGIEPSEQIRDTAQHRRPEDGISNLSGLQARDCRLKEPWRLRVLVADDCTMDREWIAGQLKTMEEFDAEITLAASVAEAQKLIGENIYDAVLADYQLGDGYGDQIVQSCQQLPRPCATIMISSHAMSEVTLYAVRAGATAAISKDDLNASLLETTIRFALANNARSTSR